ncbi:MAG: hypothetical protein MRK00_07345 [Nitrosomonas sp.]|nr:hypothetical protein [Nitrosomonas sp.]
MKYPEWAPKVLIEQHKNKLYREAPIVYDSANITDVEGLEFYNKYLFLTISKGSDQESAALLGKLITDLRMKKVWGALTKRTDDDLYFCLFFSVCEDGIEGWKNDLKHTSADRKIFYNEIHETSQKLINLMKKSGRFDYYSLTNFVDNSDLEKLLKLLDSPYDTFIADLVVSEIMPQISDILNDISEKARQYGEEELSVKKPNSENAGIHYFVRKLSQYLRYVYKQPLHDVVAMTTEVVFDRPNVDSDYVRKLVG